MKRRVFDYEVVRGGSIDPSLAMALALTNGVLKFDADENRFYAPCYGMFPGDYTGIPLDMDEIDSFAEFWWASDHDWGHVIWLARRRFVRPVKSIERKMRADGAWTPDLDSLELKIGVPSGLRVRVIQGGR